MANVIDSPFTTYGDVTPQRRVITDVLSLIDPTDTPAIELIGGLDGASGKFRFVNGPGKVVEWLEDTHNPLSDLISGSITSTTTTITMADASIVQEGHIILIDSEQMWISSVNTGTNVITVSSRTFAGTQATHADSAVVSIIGMARLEGAESDDIAFTDRYTGSNFTQIFHQEVKVTRTQRQIAQYGIADEFLYQQNKAVPQLTRQIEKHLFYNTASASGSTSAARIMGGLRAFVSTNKGSGASLAQSQFENLVKSAYAAGGSGPWSALLSPTNLQKVKNFYDSSNFLKVDRTETTVGMVITTVLTPFGQVDLVLDRWATNTEIVVLDLKEVGMLTLYPFTFEPLAKTGDYDRGEVVGEFTLCLRQEKAAGVLTAVS